MIVAEVSIEPIGTGKASYSDIVAESVKALERQKDVKYEITAMSTVLEGDRSTILRAVQEMEEACFKAGAQRCVTNLRIDERRDKPMHGIQEMERVVETKIGQPPQPGLRM
ncbi:MAG: MTH1187 family thiamine-binding protein [Chloroflexi bacterium]|nr:MTH1187 family thiamine-binding protein [Chloroflexota bacterium]